MSRSLFKDGTHTLYNIFHYELFIISIDRKWILTTLIIVSGVLLVCVVKSLIKEVYSSGVFFRNFQNPSFNFFILFSSLFYLHIFIFILFIYFTSFSILRLHSVSYCDRTVNEKWMISSHSLQTISSLISLILNIYIYIEAKNKSKLNVSGDFVIKSDIMLLALHDGHWELIHIHLRGESFLFRGGSIWQRISSTSLRSA